MPMFLYNYSDRKLHGIYRSVSPGSYELNDRGADLMLDTLPCSL